MKALRHPLSIVLALGACVSGRLASGQWNQIPCTIDGGDHLGFSVAAVPDVDGDSWQELLVGAPQERTEQPGYVLLVSGRTGKVLHTFKGSEPGDSFGVSTANAGDLNGDGQADHLIGAYSYWEHHSPTGLDEPKDRGYVQAFSAADRSLLYTVEAPAGWIQFGWKVGSLGDVNDDARPDFWVAAPTTDVSSGQDGGMILVYSGSDGAPLYTIESGSRFDGFGYAVAALADVNGDGVSDLAVGAPKSSYLALYSGSDGALLNKFDGPKGSEGVGWSVLAVGDQDGDGKSEILAGTDCAQEGKGCCVVLLKSSGNELTAMSISEKHSARKHDAFCDLGDVDSDGFADIAALVTTKAEVLAPAFSIHQSKALYSPLRIQAECWNPFDALAVATLRDSPDATKPAALAIGMHGLGSLQGNTTPGCLVVARIDSGEVLWTLKAPEGP
jgi:FG-GAP repeat